MLYRSKVIATNVSLVN